MALADRLGVSRSAAVAIAGAALLLVAAVLPWSVEAGGPAYSGFDHDHGYVHLVLAAVVPTLLLGYGWTRRTRVAVGAAGVLPVYAFAKWFLAIRAESVSEPAIGLHLTLVAGLTIVGSAVWSLRDETAGPEGTQDGRRQVGESAERDRTS